MDEVLDRFSAPTRAWFASSFATPTTAQAQAWRSISAGGHTLVVAPTGSGKTLSAFLWALDRLAVSPPPQDPLRRCRVLYISPLKALAVDVERNLRSPLVGIAHAAARMGLPPPQVSVAVRSGDTPPHDRREFLRHPSDILITTPESLFLLLTSQARQRLAGVDTVILDEVHAVAGTKRGAHLAVTLARLDALTATPAQRIGLSATVRPVSAVSDFLGGGAAVQVIQPVTTKEWDLQVVVPVPDLTDLDSAGNRPGGSVGDEESVGLARPAVGSGASVAEAVGDPRARASIWPHVEERITDLVASHRSTLVFANSRRLAERLTARLNDIWHERRESSPGRLDGPATAGTGPDDQPCDAHCVDAASPDGQWPAEPGRDGPWLGQHAQHSLALAAPGDPPRRNHRPSSPAQLQGQAGIGSAAPPLLARAHHGSVSRQERALVEEELKAGRLPAVVATSSLELGIDMGAIDLVVQVESPPSVASGVQRVGRAGHQVGAVSRAVLFPTHRGDLVQTAVVVERMRHGLIESLTVPSNPLDVLAQQIVAMCAVDEWSVPRLHDLLRTTAPFRQLSRPVLDAVLDMLAGRYPSDDFAQLRPRIVWDRLADTIVGRPGAQHLAVVSGGTIPDRGLFGVFLASGEGPGRRVGELDEEMVYETRVGDVITLGTTSWRVEEITHDRVLVTPAPGQAGRLPFWKGDAPGRPAELGRAVGEFLREVLALPAAAARERVRASGLDEWATDNLLAYLSEQQVATGQVPHDRRIVIERFRDEIGDWRIVVHSPYGASVHAPWALGIAAAMRARFGVEVQALAADDGVVLRLPDTDLEDGDNLAELAELICLDPSEVTDVVTAQLGGSALFAARFRECATRALLLPRRRPDRRQALWQQRQRAAALLEVASRFPTFPIVLETMRECLRDVFDVPALVQLMQDIADRRVRVSTVDTAAPSPFARSLLFGYIAQFLYEGDSPLAERRAAALSLDPALLQELLGTGAGALLRDLLDPLVVTQTEAGLQLLSPDRQADSLEAIVDVIRRVGPVSTPGVHERCAPERRDELPGWLAQLVADRRVMEIRIAGRPRWAVVEDAARLRDGLGVALPVGLPPTLLEPTDDPLGQLAARFARTHGPFTAHHVAAWLGIGPAMATEVLRRLVSTGRLVEGQLRPPGCGPPDLGFDSEPVPTGGSDYCDVEVLRTLRRRSLAALRSEVEPVTAAELARFLPSWHGIGGSERGVDALLRAVEQLSGSLLAASSLETLVLPARVSGYTPSLLDELLAVGEITWQGHAQLPGGDGWLSLHLGETAPLTVRAVRPIERSPLHEAVLDTLGSGAGFFFTTLAQAVHSPSERALAEVIGELLWAGYLTNDSLAPIRAGLATRAARAHPRAGGRGPLRRSSRALGSLGHRPRLASGAAAARSAPAGMAGRWSLLTPPEPDPTVRAYATAEVLLDRHGVLTRGAVAMEDYPGGFAGIYRVLTAAEDSGRVRRGYFVEGLGGAQFASAVAVDDLRGWRSERPGRTPPSTALVLAASDPANPYGAALPWPAAGRAADDPTPGSHRPGRKAGSLVVLSDGRLIFYLERGGRSLLSFTEDAKQLAAGAQALAQAVQLGALGRLSVERADGAALLGSDHPVIQALTVNGFHLTPRGLRLRR